jgi:hypothetical protein
MNGETYYDDLDVIKIHLINVLKAGGYISIVKPL